MKGPMCASWCFCNHFFCGVVLLFLAVTLLSDVTHLLGGFVESVTVSASPLTLVAAAASAPGGERMRDAVIAVEGITKRYGTLVAVDDVSFEVSSMTSVTERDAPSWRMTGRVTSAISATQSSAQWCWRWQGCAYARPAPAGCRRQCRPKPNDAALAELSFADARKRVLEAFEKPFLEAALERHGGNVSATARTLGVHRQSLQKTLRRLDISRGGQAFSC